MPETQLEVIADYRCQTGEGPLWHSDEKKLYWVDIPNGKLFRYDPATGEHECCYDDRPIGGYTIQADGDLLLFRDRGNVVTWRDGKLGQTILDQTARPAETRFNDVVADPEGRVFCGTMSGQEPGRLYRLDPDGSLHSLLEDQGTPNGMGYSPDLATMYYNDSNKARTWAFDYDRANGAITNQRLFRDANANPDPGRPDGLAVDAEGYVWTARWDGASVLRFSPAGKLDAQFDVPDAQRVSSLTFAPRYDEAAKSWSQELIDIYLTTAGGPDRPETGPAAGVLYRMRIPGDPHRGQAEFRSRIGIA